jgi:ADP-ribosyl-[dinitrogen reductase] hydrolase
VTETVNQGGDADTTGALAGMLAGALYGVQDIPKVWLNRLDSKVAAEIREQVASLLRLAGAVEGRAAD